MSSNYRTGQTEFKIGDKVLLKNHTPTNTSDSKYKPGFRICKRISYTAVDVQHGTGKIRWVSIQHLQSLYPPEHILIHLPDMTSFGQTTKYINHPNLMSDLLTAVNFRNKCS